MVSGTTVQASGDPTNANEYSVSRNVISLHSAQSGRDIDVSYKYLATVEESRDLQGDPDAGPGNEPLFDSIGVIEAGTVYTSEFDTTVDWSFTTDTAPVALTIGSDGLFSNTTSGSTAVIQRATVIQFPTAAFPWLGMRLHG